MDGEGTEVFADGSRFAGTFRRGVKDGAGVYTFADGARFEGVWQDGCRVSGQYVAGPRAAARAS